jgi:hypothetical protein
MRLLNIAAGAARRMSARQFGRQELPIRLQFGDNGWGQARKVGVCGHGWLSSHERGWAFRATSAATETARWGRAHLTLGPRRLVGGRIDLLAGPLVPALTYPPLHQCPQSVSVGPNWRFE